MSKDGISNMTPKFQTTLKTGLNKYKNLTKLIFTRSYSVYTACMVNKKAMRLSPRLKEDRLDRRRKCADKLLQA
jgi:hypothetical protein